MATKVENDTTRSYTAEGVTLTYKPIGHNHVRVELPDNMPKSLPDQLQKAVRRIQGITRAKLTREGNLLLTIRARAAKVSFKQLVNSALQTIAQKISRTRKKNPGSITQSKDKQQFVNRKTKKPALATT